ncbi:FHA domain protein (macronuclear) [Tetrahymena thermophila SB210]|uniref:E3 ubiquitin-protein ligase CHFR n=1 Tax=Tetrahymena thermophila (strain SB210) TaxID=312017 RepID=I7M7A2_TETTS|nr:FHA domain protein [Tetrahymena thermophila SB210]EAR90847.1 FHA domain protein [Tetrahymena thermophila SB210]|eukprot:XP_001011092.1 FHA domain protein [Tetrahymena thermophila SB210]
MDIWGKLTSINRKSLNLTEYLDQDTIKVGRSENNQIVIDHPKISKVHCILTRQDDGVYIEDKSSNGTYIQNNLIGKDQKVKVSTGDIIYLLRKDKVKAQCEDIGMVYSTVNIQPMQTEPEEQFNNEVDKIKEKLKKERELKQKIDKEIIEQHNCSICQDLIYDYVQLDCCIHGFCGGCLSEYLQSNQTCPDCRQQINFAFKNPKTNSTIEALRKTSQIKRYPEEYEELDLKNVITSSQTSVDELIKLFKRKTQTSAYQSKLSEILEKQQKRINGQIDSDYSYQSENEDEEDLKIKPEECPECKIARMDDSFKCKDSQKHQKCTGCKRMFPDRPERQDQRCVVCKDPYCGLYLGVCKNNLTNQKKTGKYLAQFNDFKAPQNIAQNIFRANKVELQIFNDFLRQNNLTNQSMLDEMKSKFISQNNFFLEKSKSILSNYNDKPTNIQINLETPVCSECFPVIWHQIVFRYRIYIKNKLPARYCQRPNCHWGINCTTQITKQSHAETYDHVCEQTRFA